MIGYRENGLKKFEILDSKKITFTDIKSTGNFSDCLYEPKIDTIFAFNGEKQLLYKMKNSEFLTVFFDEIYFKALPGR